MKYFLRINEEKRGPYGEEEIREMLGRGVIPTVTLALEENGSDEWRLSYLPALIGPAKATPSVAKPYYILQEDGTQGPFTIGQLRGMWSMGRLTGKTMHCQEGDSEWHPLSAILDQLEPPPEQRPAVTQPSMLVVTPRKSRGVYIILGLFLGTLGIHNFYAGYHGRGAAQLIITLLLGWVIIGLLITVPWALIEICLVTEDTNGDRMA
jgi:TM2 domain-containing membrane protein YozV